MFRGAGHWEFDHAPVTIQITQTGHFFPLGEEVTRAKGLDREGLGNECKNVIGVYEVIPLKKSIKYW